MEKVWRGVLAAYSMNIFKVFAQKQWYLIWIEIGVALAIYHEKDLPNPFQIDHIFAGEKSDDATAAIVKQGMYTQMYFMA